MSEFETLSRDQKQDLVLQSLFVYGTGIDAYKTIAQILDCGVYDIEKIIEILESDGLIKVDRFDTTGDAQRISITEKGVLLNSNGELIDQPLKTDITSNGEYGRRFHAYSKRVHILSDRLFWLSAALILVMLFYCMWAYATSHA
jgi:hypothetical protein